MLYILLTSLMVVVWPSMSQFIGGTIPTCWDTQKERNGVVCDCAICYNQMTIRRIDACCVCNSMLTVDLAPLGLEYTTAGSGEIYGDKGNNSELIHTNGGLMFLPWNMCDFPLLRRVDLANNMIVTLQDLSCLSQLDEIIVRNNLIDYLSKDTFDGVESLRILDMSRNYIHLIEAETLGVKMSNLKMIHFDGNELDSIDVSSMFSMNFCNFTFTGNKINRFVNEMNISAVDNVYHGSGWIFLENNNLSRLPDLDSLGVGNLTYLGLFDYYKLKVDGNPIICDCFAFPFYYKVDASIKITNNYTLVCSDPPHMRGRDVQTQVRPEDLICNLTDNCPVTCQCWSQPSNHRLVVDCENAGLTSLPAELPAMQELQLDIRMSGNRIKNLEDREYLSRVRHIDLSSNVLETIIPDVPKSLENASSINLEGNQVKRIPKEIQIFSTSVLSLDVNYVTCDCQLEWMPDWVLNYHPNTTNTTCSLGNTNITVYLDYYLLTSCKPEDLISVILGGVLGPLALLTIIAAALSYIYRYEVLVLVYIRPRTCLKRGQNRDIDVFLSVGEEDIVWAKDVLIPFLEENHVEVFVPERDILPGEVEVDAILKAVDRSKHALVVLSDAYLKSPPKMEEFNYLCNSMVTTFSDTNMTILMHPDANVEDTENPYLRAFWRVGKIHRGRGMDTVVPALRPTLPLRMRYDAGQE